MLLYLDPGHGGEDSGAIGNGLREKDLTLNIALKIRKILEQYDIKVAMSRESDKTVSLKQRTDEAKKLKADFFLSIHINAGGGFGYEDFIYEKLGDASETNRVRSIIHDEVMKQIDLKDRGKKKANYHVLRESTMNATLTENGFIDSIADSYKLKSDSYLLQIALGHVNGLVRAFGLKKKNVTPPTPAPSNDVFYRVVTGSFKDRKNAQDRVDELKKKGFDSFIDIK